MQVVKGQKKFKKFEIILFNFLEKSITNYVLYILWNCFWYKKIISNL